MSNISDKKIRADVFNKFNGRCAYCGCKLNSASFVVDHIKALRRGEKDKSKKGSNDIDNFYPSCYSCNSSKGVFTIEQWRHELLQKTRRLNRDNSSYRIAIRFGLIKEISDVIKFYFERYE